MARLAARQRFAPAIVFPCLEGSSDIWLALLQRPLMQTLGLSETTTRSDNRLKSLFWPSIQSGADVDYLGAQGYWVCALLAVFSFILLAATGHPIIGVLILLFLYLSGVGVRERSPYAAAIVFIFYLADAATLGFGVVRILVGALLLSNFRATWIASQWKPDSEQASLPPRLSETWGDKFSDKLPAWLWPRLRVFYYILSVLMLVLLAAGTALIILRRIR